MAELLFVEHDGGAVRRDAVQDGPLSARAQLPSGVLGTIVMDRLQQWADTQALLRWEVQRRRGRLRLEDETTTVVLDLVSP